MKTNSALRLICIMFFAATTAEGAIQSRLDREGLRRLDAPIAPGARVDLDRVRIGNADRTLELERFEVWAPDAEIVADHGDGTRTRMSPPAVKYYRGTVDGDPESLAFIAVASDGTADGLVVTDDVRYKIRTQADRAVTIEEANPLDDYPIDGSFSCDLEGTPIVSKRALPNVQTDAFRKAVADGTLSATGTWTLNLAIETDYELYVDMGSNATTVNTFIGNVIAAVSTIYRRDLRTDLLIAYSRVQTSSSDPFTIVPGATGTWNGSTTTYSTSHALAELGDIWASNATRPYNGARSSVILMSGKNQTAGVAWIGTSCTGNFTCSGGNCGSALFDGHTGGPYAYIGLGNPSTTVPNPDATVNGIQYGLPAANYWPVLGVAHELGHNVDGPHTHCFGLTSTDKATYGVTRDYIDVCVNGCWGGATSVPPEKGTVMSYCHLLGSSQSRFLFGKAGEPSELMKNHIMSYINSVTPASPAISAPASVNAGASANASVVSPSGSLTYQWSVVNGTINGSSTATTVNFTATAHPVTLRLKSTNASGCSASESASVTVNTCTSPAITALTPSATVLEGATVELSATASGTSPVTYQWYIGTSGDTSTPAGVGNPLAVTPLATTSYWVRATNACGSADGATVTITVGEPQPAGLYFLTPCRAVDTRDPVGPYGGPALANGSTRTIQLTGRCGIPAGATAAVANVTAVSPSATGTLSFYPAGTAWPGTGTMSYRAGKTRATNTILVLSDTGRVTVLNNGASQHFIVDVTGYFQ